jgi:hypothetical protein
VVTVTVLLVVAAPLVIAQLAGTDVLVAALAPVQVTPVPDIATAFAPLRFFPTIITGTVAPRAPLPGVIDEIVG